jgi:hypothetical protein
MKRPKNEKKNENAMKHEALKLELLSLYNLTKVTTAVSSSVKQLASVVLSKL